MSAIGKIDGKDYFQYPEDIRKEGIAFRMHQEMVRRLVVVVSGKVAGIIREQDLFFEMEKILNC